MKAAVAAKNLELSIIELALRNAITRVHFCVRRDQTPQGHFMSSHCYSELLNSNLVSLEPAPTPDSRPFLVHMSTKIVLKLPEHAS